jgi:hypothetical protein
MRRIAEFPGALLPFQGYTFRHFRDSSLREEAGEYIGPHAIPIIVNEAGSFSRKDLSNYLEKHGIEARTLLPPCLPSVQEFLTY